MIWVARGRLNKQIAGDIGIAEGTVKVHRSRLMQKMNARSLPELSRMAEKLKLVSEKPQHSCTGVSVLYVSRDRPTRVCRTSGSAAVILAS
jgi:Bacterial regulatory proteins, luxR family